MTTSTILEPPLSAFQERPAVPSHTVGEQQTKMALAAFTPRVELVRPTGLVRPWVVARGRSLQEAEPFDVRIVELSPRKVERTLRCPYCRSTTYEVSVSAGPSGMVARGVCSLCGTHGVSYRPSRLPGRPWAVAVGTA